MRYWLLVVVFVLTACGEAPTADVRAEDQSNDPSSDGFVACVTDDDCQNPQPCTGHEVCLRGVCMPGQGIHLLDSTQCTDDICDLATGVIRHPPVDVDDEDPCTEDGCTDGIGIWHILLDTPECSPGAG